MTRKSAGRTGSLLVAVIFFIAANTQTTAEATPPKNRQQIRAALNSPSQKTTTDLGEKILLTKIDYRSLKKEKQLPLFVSPNVKDVSAGEDNDALYIVLAVTGVLVLGAVLLMVITEKK